MQKVFLLAGVAACTLPAASHDDDKVEEKSTVPFNFSGAKKLDVDLVSGNITVIADGGAAIRAEGERVIRARDRKGIDMAKKEVALDRNEKDGTAQLYANGPFRWNRRGEETHGFHEHTERAYEVIHNLTVHVPAKLDLRLHTVNGKSSTKGVTGELDISSVNCSLAITEMGGFGRISAVNGPITADFRSNPTGDLNVKSVNGKIELNMPSNLSAKLIFTTLNSGVYTDFEGTALALPSDTGARDGDRFIRKGNSRQTIQVGDGATEIKLETVNGTIQIRKRK